MSDQERKSAFDTFWGSSLLPSATDQLFATATDARREACLNYFSNAWTFYAVGYKDAADALVDQFMRTGHHPLIHPIISNYRHYLELSLKDLIRQARQCLRSTAEFPMVHRLDELWRKLCGLLDELGSDTARDEMQQIGRLIDEFMAVDPWSQAFRYPEDRQGNPSLPGIEYVDVANVRGVINKIAVILDGADAMLDQYLSFKSEIGGY